MSYTHRVFCTTCCDKEEYKIKGRPKTITYPAVYSYEELYAVCRKCGTEVYCGPINDRNVYAMHKAMYEALEKMKED